MNDCKISVDGHTKLHKIVERIDGGWFCHKINTDANFDLLTISVQGSYVIDELYLMKERPIHEEDYNTLVKCKYERLGPSEILLTPQDGDIYPYYGKVTLQRKGGEDLTVGTVVEITYWTKDNKVESEAKDSGDKYDEGKSLVQHIPPEFIVSIGDVIEFGAKKYAINNWKKGILVSKLLGSCLRHILAFSMGEDKDPESGHSHLAHAATNLSFIMWMIDNKPELDDRSK
jgi:hypothetical protein